MKQTMVELIKERTSCRTYDKRLLTLDEKQEILGSIASTNNPFDVDVRIHYIERGKTEDNEKLGTYGMIKGASSFLGVTVEKKENALLAVGYQFEELILKLTGLGFGTVWMAGTFKKDQFAHAMHIGPDDVFVAISPVGHPQTKSHLLDKIARTTLKSNQRKPWEELFFDNSFDCPLTDAKEYATALEMVRLGPSATNSQPWRIVKQGNTFHFFETHKSNAKEEEKLVKQVDIGIALCHFDLVTKEQGIYGTFVKEKNLTMEVPENTTYLMSWQAQE